MHLILVHGGFHGAWCWDRVIPELERLGHRASALDLPGHGERAAERPATYRERIQPILDAMEGGDVLVGHSGGGYDNAVAANEVPEKVGHMIFLAAGLPVEGKSVVEATGGATKADESGRPHATRLMDDATGMLANIHPLADGTMEWHSLEGARQFFYHDCDDDTVQWAFSKLSPGISPFPEERLHLPRFWAAELPRSFIRCLQDRSMPSSMCAEVVHRLGVEPLAIDASHSPFLSRPRELAELFVEAAATRPVGPLLSE